MTAASKKKFVTFSPDLRADDPLANYWLRQVTLRLRRELCWRWHECGLTPKDENVSVPPFSDKTSAALDLTRFWEHKQKFFASDVTARYLTEQIVAKPPTVSAAGIRRGSFSWAVKQLSLDPAAVFLFALTLAPAFDASVGSIISACLNDCAKSSPNLSLLQKLWDRPEEALLLAYAQHPLFRSGLLKTGRPGCRAANKLGQSDHHPGCNCEPTTLSPDAMAARAPASRQRRRGPRVDQH
jgi:hypothetical protein